MAVQQRAGGNRRERQIEAARLGLAGEEFLERQGVRGETPGTLILHDRRDLVAEAEDAARFEAHHRHAARDEWIECRERTLDFFARLVHLADREKRAAAAEWPREAVGWRGE